MTVLEIIFCVVIFILLLLLWAAFHAIDAMSPWSR